MASYDTNSHLFHENKSRKQSISTTLTSDLIESGVELLAAGEIPAAVEELSEACRFLSEEFGECGEECALAYLYYGKALLELGKLENNVLGNALEGFDVSAQPRNGGEKSVESSVVEDVEAMTRDEQEDVEERVAAALEENFEKIDQIAKVHTAAESETDNEADSTDEDETVDEVVGDCATKDENAQATEETDDTGNLEAAWEVLELAKLLFSKTVARTSGERRVEAEENLCSTMLALAEVSIEIENYVIAVDDLKQCLENCETVLSSNPRYVAEVQYQLGLSLGYLARLPEAEAAVEEAISVLKMRREGLRKESPSETRDKELAELEALILDVGEAKIGLPDIAERSNKETEGVEGFSKAVDGKAASTIGIKRAAEDNFAELAKKGRVEGPAMA